MVSLQCSYVEYPEHAQRRFRSGCKTNRMKEVFNMKGSKKLLYPYKVYCSRSIKTSVEDMLKRPGFKELLHQGPNELKNGTLIDVCDGMIYKSVTDNNGKPFFQDKRNIGVMFNVDWFNPFKRTEYSLGVMYLVLLNLPRSERFKWENVVVLGIIPGPKEPSLTINTYLKPIVDELLQFWSGVVLKEQENPALYKLALLCISNDIPATRKCGGFLGHNAKKGTTITFTLFVQPAGV